MAQTTPSKAHERKHSSQAKSADQVRVQHPVTPSPYDGILALQRVAGNRAVSDVIHSVEGPTEASSNGRTLVGEGQSRADLANVRVHIGSKAQRRARAEGAAAFTSGQDVYLGQGLDPASDLGQRAITHELVHAVQQARGRAGHPIVSQTSLEAEANAVSGIGGTMGPIQAGAAMPGSVQKITEAELQEEWRRLHPPKPGAFRSANPFEIEGGPDERAAYKTWRAERLQQRGEESAAKVREWTEADEARMRAAKAAEASSTGVSDMGGQPAQGPIDFLPSEVFIPVAQPSKPVAPPRPRKRNLAAEAKAAWEARTSPRKKAEAAKTPPPRTFVSEHERKLIELSTMLDVIPGAKLGRNIIEFITGEDVLERKLSRREVSREVSKEILLQIAPLLIPEGGLIGESGGAEAPVLERELGETAPILEGEPGSLGGLSHETIVDLPPTEPIKPGLEVPEAPVELPTETPMQMGETEPEIDVTQESGLELEHGPVETRPVPYNEVEPEIDVTEKSGLSLAKSEKARRQAFRMRPEKPKFGEPSGEVVGTGKRKGQFFREFNEAELGPGHLNIEYDRAAGRPIKVSFELNEDALAGSQQTERSFKPDISVEAAQPKTDAFINSGYERGHLGPREALKTSAAAEEAADLTTNVVPMKTDLNQGVWREAEIRANTLAKQYGGVRVEVEPIYDANPPRLSDGTPIPKAVHRKVMTLDGQILEDASYLNR